MTAFDWAYAEAKAFEEKTGAEVVGLAIRHGRWFAEVMYQGRPNWDPEHNVFMVRFADLGNAPVEEEA